MSTLLSVQSVSYETSIKKLFENISFSIQSGERIGLIGHNGSGKSTLLHLITQQLPLNHGNISFANHCVYAYIEQHLPSDLTNSTVLEAVLSKLSEDKRMMESWRAEILLAKLGFHESQYHQSINTLSGGQHTRLLLGRALMNQPDLLFLDEPSNHLDLPTILWLTQFLQNWRGTFVLVSHDQNLLDQVTNTTWILRDESLHHFQLPCSEARQALIGQDIADEHRHKAEQKEIDRITHSVKRLALWGKTYDNESFARKAKKMEKQIAQFEGAIILVSHDQWLIENSCQRFGLIHQQHFIEYSEPESAYQVLLGTTALDTCDHAFEIQSEMVKIEHGADVHEDLLLREWVELEQKLADDLVRKPTHQKPLLQKQWKERLLEFELLLNQ
ncbi:ATP-binding cassette domain-containing protein [Wohlfahrtiimonas larvae]|uniref:ABC transporter domain-containing protein n=1 Tax=Wohlfahrtiimonas larvae TaxID=1157986 RepID=A0ABP9MMP7_9GAMM|nr:ATP-binding cassette domain-containing protein [Wohlfahrtiimonas larvae]